MVGSDSEKNVTESCWSWKLFRFTSEQRFRQLSVYSPTPVPSDLESEAEEVQEPSTSSSGHIDVNSESSTSPNTSRSSQVLLLSPPSNKSSSPSIFKLLGTKFKSNNDPTRHLVRSLESIESTSKSQTKSKGETPSRYTKLPLGSASARNSNLQTVCSASSSDRFVTTSESIRRSPSFLKKLLRKKSKSDNNLHKIDSNSNPTLLNSVQAGDHAAIRIPWTAQSNDLNSSSSTRVHPHTHKNNLSKSSPQVCRKRSKSLERSANSRILLKSSVVNNSSSCSGENSSDSSGSIPLPLKNQRRPPSPPPRPIETLLPSSDKNIGAGLKYKSLDAKSGCCSTSFCVRNATQGAVVCWPGNNSDGSSSGGSNGGMTLESVRGSGFINKPAKGWLHADHELCNEGIDYIVRYIGCLDVNTSMKNLDFETRSLIAKECINQVCEAAGLKSTDKKRKMDEKVGKIIGSVPKMEHAGTDVRLTITSTRLKLTSLDSGAIIAAHDMPNISFASGGDEKMLDFVAYVAKDAIIGRACYILECGSGLSQDVITTVGQAFELRFREYLQKKPGPSLICNNDPEYYNDLPGKAPPAASCVEEKENNLKPNNVSGLANKKKREPPRLTLQPAPEKESDNLIDFEAPTPPAFGPSVSVANIVLDEAMNPLEKKTEPTPNDPFDMQPFGNILNGTSVTADEQRAELETQLWFHGTISRDEAESLLVADGDFLVRESQTCPGQYVLTGLQNDAPKHLLLVDPAGIVRTKDRTFGSISHLISHHFDNSMPIISAESVILLRHPVPKM